MYTMIYLDFRFLFLSKLYILMFLILFTTKMIVDSDKIALKTWIGEKINEPK